MGITVQIIGTDSERSLSIRSAEGVDWTADLIGNVGMLDAPADNGGFERIVDADGEPTGSYRATAETYEWWAKYIADLETTTDDLATLQDALDEAGLDGGQIIQERYHALVGGVDMEDERGQAVDLMEHIREEYLAEQE